MTLPLGLTAGCTSVEPSPERPYAAAYPGPTPDVETGAPPSAPPPAASGVDQGVAEAIHRVLRGDANLAAASRKVQASVRKGVVTLRGTVPTDHDREEIISRISKLPGVDRVEDQLETPGKGSGQ